MDYMAFVDAHRQSGADVTIGCLPCDGERAQDFGLMKIDTVGNVTVRLSTAPHRSPDVQARSRILEFFEKFGFKALDRPRSCQLWVFSGTVDWSCQSSGRDAHDDLRRVRAEC